MKSLRGYSLTAVLLAAALTCSSVSEAAEKAKEPPPTVYWMSVATQNHTIPGMEQQQMTGLSGMMGKAMGMPEMGPKRSLQLQLNSPRTVPPEPLATHDIPPGQKMGDTLPLLIPVYETTKHTDEEPQERTMEKPKMRMLIYWGCGESVRKGQPKVLDTEKMSPMEFGKALSSRSLSRQYPPRPRSGWAYADWPNKKNSLTVPKDSSLVGKHFIHGNYMPDITFSIPARHDFMDPVDFTSVTGELSDSIRFQWGEVPTAIGYFGMVIAHSEKAGETIIWTSSDVEDAGFGFLDYVPSSDVRKLIKDRVVMPSSTTSCTIPKGIFKDAGGAALQFIAYGEDMYAEYPPRPKDPKQPYHPIWTAKVRLKSTGMLVLGEGMGERGEKRSKRAPKDEWEDTGQPSREEKKEESKSPLNMLKGLFR